MLTSIYQSKIHQYLDLVVQGFITNANSDLAANS